MRGGENMDQVQPLSPGRFLELLNKSPKTPEEETELQTELKRQNEAKAAEVAAQVPVAPEQPNDQAAQPPVEPTPPTEQVLGQSTPPVETPAQPEVPAEEETYSLTQLVAETQEAIAYLKGLDNQSEAVQMATAAYVQAAYLVSLVNK